MKIQVNLFILFYISLCSCSWLESNRYVDNELPAQLELYFYDKVCEGDTTKGFLTEHILNFTLRDCKAIDLCSESMKYGKEFIDNLVTLDVFEVVSFVLKKNENELRQPINDTAYWYEYSSDEFESEPIGDNTPRDFHYADKYKFIITIPIYLVCSIIAALVYLNKRQLLVTMNFKFSNISRILFKYISVKLVFGSVYLAYLVLFDDFSLQHLGNFKILVTLTILRYILNLASFLLVVLFAFGYCISFFTFTNRRPVLWKVCGLTLLYGIQSVPKFFYELQDMKNARQFYFTQFKSRLPLPIAVCFIVLYIVIVCALAYIAYRTYKLSLWRDARFLFSFQIILAAYVLSPLVVVPYELSTIPDFIRNKYLLNDRGAMGSYSEGVHIPDVIELFAIGALIYIWRDLKYVENDGDVYDMVDNSEYELEEIH